MFGPAQCDIGIGNFGRHSRIADQIFCLRLQPPAPQRLLAHRRHFGRREVAQSGFSPINGMARTAEALGNHLRRRTGPVLQNVRIPGRGIAPGRDGFVRLFGGLGVFGFCGFLGHAEY